MLPPSERAGIGRSGIWLRLTPPKNGQRASINIAEDFELPGAVAQLAEHALAARRPGVRIPSAPLSAVPETLQVGAQQFRNHFGYYLEKAGEGHEVLVSRRGRPYVRLTPVEPPLELVACLDRRFRAPGAIGHTSRRDFAGLRGSVVALCVGALLLGLRVVG